MLNHHSPTSRVCNAPSPSPRSPSRKTRSGLRSVYADTSYCHGPSPAPKLATPKPSYPIVLNSSPIKTRLPIAEETLLSSSPTKFAKKSVAFSDDLIQDSLSPRVSTPRKSILKAFDLQPGDLPFDPNNTSQWSDYHGPFNSEFWVPGTIIQLPPNSPHFGPLISGCMTVLKASSFALRFEVYATMNYSYKVNAGDVAKELVGLGDYTDQESPSKVPKRTPTRRTDFNDLNSIPALMEIIHEDILNNDTDALDAKDDQQNPDNDPLKARITSQALKLICSIILNDDLNKYVPISEAKWLYSRACSILQNPTCTRAAALPYLLLLKECKFSASRKRALFDSSLLPESILKSLIGLSSFSSSLVVCEKFLCFKSLVVNFPGIMAKNLHHWFGHLVLNLCSLSPHYYLKCIGVGINCIMEVAKVFLDDKVVHLEVRRFLASSMPTDVRSFSSNTYSDIYLGTAQELPELAISYLVHRLQLMIDVQQYRSAMDIWVALTLLVGSPQTGFNEWTDLTQWLSVRRYCYEHSRGNDGRVIAVTSAKAIIYNVCHDDFDDLRLTVDPIMRDVAPQDRVRAVGSATKQKAGLLLEYLVDADASRLAPEVVESMHGVFLSILYTLLNPNVTRPKYLYLYWDKVIQPVLTTFYAAEGKSTATTHALAMNLMRSFLGSGLNNSEKSHNNIRCLAGSAVQLSEISALPPRWIFLNFERILHNVVVLFESHFLLDTNKLNILQSFLINVKICTKKEKKPSEDTYDLIDNLPFLIEKFLSNTELVPETLRALAKCLIDTFDINMLAGCASKDSAGSERRPGVLRLIFCSSSLNSPAASTVELFRLIAPNLKTTELLHLSAGVLQAASNEPYINRCVLSCLAERQFEANESQIRICGDLCTHISQDFEPFVKRFLQLIVLLPSASDVKRLLLSLNVQCWQLPIFNYYLMLVRNAPNTTIRQLSTDLLLKRVESEPEYVSMVEFLVSSMYFEELSTIKKVVLIRAASLRGPSRQHFAEVWANAVAQYVAHTSDRHLVDEMLATTVELSSVECGDLIPTTSDDFPLFCEALSRRGNKGEAFSKRDNKSEDFSRRNTKCEQQMMCEQEHDSKREARMTPEVCDAAASGKPHEIDLVRSSRHECYNVDEEELKKGEPLQSGVTLLTPSPEPNISTFPFQENTQTEHAPSPMGPSRVAFTSFTTRSRQKKAGGAAPIVPHISDAFDINMYASMVAQQLNLSPASRARHHPAAHAMQSLQTLDSSPGKTGDYERDEWPAVVNNIRMMHDSDSNAKAQTAAASKHGLDSAPSNTLGALTTSLSQAPKSSPHKKRKRGDNPYLTDNASSINTGTSTPDVITTKEEQSIGMRVHDSKRRKPHIPKSKPRHGSIFQFEPHSDMPQERENIRFGMGSSPDHAPHKNRKDLHISRANNNKSPHRAGTGPHVGDLAVNMDEVTDHELATLSSGTQANLGSALSRFMFRVRKAVNGSPNPI